MRDVVGVVAVSRVRRLLGVLGTDILPSASSGGFHSAFLTCVSLPVECGNTVAETRFSSGEEQVTSPFPPSTVPVLMATSKNGVLPTRCSTAQTVTLVTLRSSPVEPTEQSAAEESWFDPNAH
jgi:hypothetical protein